jgi:DNA repair protein REV1
MIVTHGGGFMQYLDGKTMVTHIIASNLTPKKAIEFKMYRIVKPAWIVDSIKAGKLLPWSSYRVLDAGIGQKVLGFDNGKVISQASAHITGYRDQTDASWYTEQFKGTRIPESSGRPQVSRESSAPSVADDEIFNVPEPPRAVELRQSSPPTLPIPERKDSALPIAGKLMPPPERPVPFMASNDDDLHALTSYQPIATTELALPTSKHTNLSDRNDPQVTDDRLSVKRPGEDFTIHAKRPKLTAEEHNSILLADPRIRKSTVVNPDFLEQFYRESRLHHLSTWKADLKSELQGMADRQSSSDKARRILPEGTRRYILHVDFDSFFAAVSLKKTPQYKEKPVVVAHGDGNAAEIASCNYPARKFGIKNGMWMKKALELCPELKVLPYDFPAYEESSRSFYEIIIATGGVVQSVSVDEALVDITSICIAEGGSDGLHKSEGSTEREQAKADAIAQGLRDEVKNRTGCAVSVGIGGNVLLAKLSLRKAKPAGQYQINPDKVLDFIGDFEVQDLPGVAHSIGGRLEELGIKYVRDVREVSKEKLISTLGPKTGEKMWEYARGIDRKQVGDVEIRKSVSAEVNWGVRFENHEQVDEFIENLCGELSRRLHKEKVKGKQLTLKVMKRSADSPLDPPKHLGHGKCDTFNKSVAFGVATNAKEILAKETLGMLKSLGFSPGELRGIGVQMTKLESMKDAFAKYPDGSQRRLQFKGDGHREAPNEVTGDPIQDIVTPRKQKDTLSRVSFGAAQLNDSSPSRKPLNTLGTQFILPTQVDLTVLSDLPEDIRSKLTRNTIQHIQPLKMDVSLAKNSLPMAHTALPNQSQIDPDIFNALPSDVQQEIMSFYKPGPSTAISKQGNKPLLPQSPRAKRIGPPLKKPPTTPTKTRGRPRKTDSRPIKNTTLTQSNFITSRRPRTAPTTNTPASSPNSKEPIKEPPPGIDASYLAALPPDLRAEVVEEQRRLARNKELNREIRMRRRPNPSAIPKVKQVLHLAPRTPRPTFTSRRLCVLSELRDAISEWVGEFKDEGPYVEDTDALGSYLARVVVEERDLDKAVKSVQWLIWLVEEELDDNVGGIEAWRAATDRVGLAVQEAVKQRGLGRVKL